MPEVLSGRGRVLVSGAGFTSPRVYASSKMGCELVLRLSIATLLFGALPLISLEGTVLNFGVSGPGNRIRSLGLGVYGFWV